MMRLRSLLTMLVLIGSIDTMAAPCEAEDFQTTVSGQSECLLMRRYGSSSPDTLVVWLHGNVSTGGPANFHFKLAEATANAFAAENVMAIALVRPGYPDGTGAYSSGSDNGRADNWQRQTIQEIGKVIERLKSRFNPRTTIIVGHSGGAAIAAVLLGMQPDLAEAAILIACPCDMSTWRAGRSRTPWSSEDPLSWTAQIKPTARVMAFTGSNDHTTSAALATTYVARLRERSIKASFVLVPDAGHIDILKSPMIMEAISALVYKPTQTPE